MRTFHRGNTASAFRRRPSDAALAALTYAGGVFAAGAVLGALREVFVVPRIGVSVAIVAETPLMILVSTAICKWVFEGERAWDARADRIAIGIAALVVLVGLDDRASRWLRHRSLLSLWSDMSGLALACTLSGLLAFALIPVALTFSSASRR